jgi:hypothetical protein
MKNLKVIALFIAFILFGVNLTPVYAGSTNKVVKQIANKCKQEKLKKEKFWKEEYEKQNKNPEYTPRLYKDYVEEKKKEEKEKRVNFRNKIGFWRYIGGKLFGNWILYDKNKDYSTLFNNKPTSKTKVKKADDFMNILNKYDICLETILDADDKQIDIIYDNINGCLTDIDTKQSKRDQLIEFTAYDYERRTDKGFVSFMRDFVSAIDESNKTLNNKNDVTPIPSGSLIGL